ncbi:MAG: GNAT family N-acetyltransferase [Bacteroidota bacterium]
MNRTDIKIVFETERLIVRTFKPDDGDIFFAMNGDEEIVRYIRPVKSKEECDRFLLEVIKYSDDNPLFGRWAVHEKQTGDFAGSFAVIPVEGTENFQLGYSLLKKNWGNGYATELTKGGIVYFFEKTNYNEVYAITEAGNIPSQKVVLKCGFEISCTRKENEKEIIEFIFRKNK